jgi:hypothetical protein
MRSSHSTGGSTTADAAGWASSALSSGAKTFPSRTGRPHAGQNSEMSGIEAPQYPQEIGIRSKGSP